MKTARKIQRVRLGDAKKLTQLGEGPFMELTQVISKDPAA